MGSDAERVEAWIDWTEPLWRRWALAGMRGTLWLLYRLLGRLRVEGVEHVPRKGAVILAPNHVSAADWPAVGVAAPRRLSFMAKEELFGIPVLGWLIRIGRAFPVRRDSADRAAIRLTEALLARGEAVVLFPEGRVSEDARLQPLKLGLALIALRTGAPVVPVALLGTERLLPYGHQLPKPVREPVVVRFGAPIHLDDLSSVDRRAAPTRAALEAATERLDAALRALLTARSAPSERA
jgi:1-acyl-sn-glycerol-3-phosphate acyltransferase